MTQKPWVIFDTDMDSDCDDAGALALLLHAHNAGQIELKAVIADAPRRFAAPCCETICREYGVKVHVGAVHEEAYAEDPRFAAYRAHCEGMAESMFYNAKLAGGKRDADYPQAALLYREILKNAPDGGVTIVCVGFLTALAELLATREGVELMRRKVLRVVSMGDAPLDGNGEMNFNYRMDAAAAQSVFAKCPAPITVCPIGTEIITGKTLSAKLRAGHPVRVAYESFTGRAGCGRSSWDLVTVYRALHPEDERLMGVSKGTIHCDAEGERMYWEQNGTRQDELLQLNASFAEMEALLENMLYKA